MFPTDAQSWIPWFRYNYDLYGGQFLYFMAKEFFRLQGEASKVKAMETELMRLREAHFARVLNRYEVHGDMNQVNAESGSRIDQAASGRSIGQEHKGDQE